MNLIDCYLLEIKALQVKDTKNALEKGYNSKNKWFKYIIKQNNDYIANEIIEISNKYNIPLITVAYHFDITMIFRIKKIIIN